MEHYADTCAACGRQLGTWFDWPERRQRRLCSCGRAEVRPDARPTRRQEALARRAERLSASQTQATGAPR